MCYDKNGKLVAETFDGLHDCLFGIVVEGAGGFVEDDDVGLLVKCTGDADALALASGEADATFADESFVFFRPGCYDVGYLSLLSCLLDSVAIDFIFGHAKGNVFFDGAISKKDGLGNVSNMRLPCPVVGRGQGFCVDLDGAGCWLQEAHDEVEQGAFAAAGDTDEASATAFGYLQVEVVEYQRCLIGVTEREVVQINLFQERKRLGWWLINIIGQGLVEQFERVEQGYLTALNARPGAVSALQYGEKALGTKCKGAKNGNGFGNAVGLPGKEVGKERDKHHTKRFDAKTRTCADKRAVALSFTQGVVGVAVNLAVGALAAVDEDVADAAQSFLQGLDDLG